MSRKLGVVRAHSGNLISASAEYTFQSSHAEAPSDSNTRSTHRSQFSQAKTSIITNRAMASPVADAQSPTSPKPQSPEKGQKDDPVNDTVQQRANRRSAPGKKEQKLSQDDTKRSKKSGAELKKQAKEEKAARRAKEKQAMQVPNQSTASTLPQQAQSTPTTTPSTESAISKQDNNKQQKRRGSATAPKQLPVRTLEPQVAAVAPAPKKESKNVAFFSHLYGHPRRTSMAGAGKDIHPAVVTLGLKMSHYIILGSNARCVAMLLAFKRVGIYSDICFWLADGI